MGLKLSVDARRRYANLLGEVVVHDEFEESVVSADMQGRHGKEFYSKSLEIVIQVMKEGGGMKYFLRDYISQVQSALKEPEDNNQFFKVICQ